MNILLINIICVFFSVNIDRIDSTVLKDGFYYGRNKGFFPQNIIFIAIKKDTAFVDCFLPLKGQYFHSFSDTLILSNKEMMLYSSGKSAIYSRKKKVYFKTIAEMNKYNVRETQITNQSEKDTEFNNIRNNAKPFME